MRLCCLRVTCLHVPGPRVRPDEAQVFEGEVPALLPSGLGLADLFLSAVFVLGFWDYFSHTLNQHLLFESGNSFSDICHLSICRGFSPSATD